MYVVDITVSLYAIVAAGANALYTNAVPGAVSLYMWVDNPLIFWTSVAGAIFLLLALGKLEYMNALILLCRILLVCGISLILYSVFHSAFPNLAEGAMFVFDVF